MNQASIVEFFGRQAIQICGGRGAGQRRWGSPAGHFFAERAKEVQGILIIISPEGNLTRQARATSRPIGGDGSWTRTRRGGVRFPFGVSGVGATNARVSAYSLMNLFS